LADELPTVEKGDLKARFERIVASNPEMEPVLLHTEDPLLIYFEKFLDSETIADLLQAYTDAGLGFERSKELDSNEGQEDRRTSESIQCNTAACWRDPRVLKVHEIVTKVTGQQLHNQEFIQIVKYEEGNAVPPGYSSYTHCGANSIHSLPC
jgi:hypothetical protein